MKRLSCDEDAFSTIFSKSTTDLTKETDTQPFQSTWTNFNEDTISSLSSKSDGITHTTKGWSSYDTYEPPTRHRRDTNPSSPSTTQTTAENPSPSDIHVPVDEPPSSSEIPSTPPVANNATEVEILNITSPSPKNEKIIDAKGYKNNVIPSATTKRTPAPSTKTNEVLITEKSTKADTTTLIDDSVLEPIILTENATNEEETVNDESLIIITGETLNRTVTNSPIVTSENPQIVVVIGDNDQSESNRTDPYIVSLSDDIIINNNPSISPVEVIDVDVVELDKLTTKSTFTQDRLIDQSNLKTVLPTDNTSPKIIRSSVPTTARPVTDNVNVTTTKSSNIISTTSKVTTQETIPEVPPNQEKYPENVGELEEEKGDESDVPQRPNRGRLFTHSNHPSFYPYFLNRVLG